MRNVFNFFCRQYLTTFRKCCSNHLILNMSFKPTIRKFFVSMALMPFALVHAGDTFTNGNDGKNVISGKAPVTYDGYDPKNIVSERAGGMPIFPNVTVDLFGSGSYIYDSNTTQTPIENSASLFAFSYGANVLAGSQAEEGGYAGLSFNGQAYAYEDAAAAAGRDPFEWRLGGFVGLNRGKTRTRLNMGYYRNNGNGLQFDEVNRETRRAQSNDYNFDLSVARELSRGSIEAGAGYTLRDFDPGTGVNDGESFYGDVAGFVIPSFAPKTSLGLGLRAGSDSFDRNATQNSLTPSFRWRYRLSGKTSLYSSIGYEFRTVDGAGGLDSENLVYNGGVDWTATGKTTFALGYYSRVQPSYTTAGEDSQTSGVTLQMDHRLPGRFQLATQIGYENADYFANQVGVVSNRNDNFVRLGVDLSHPLALTDKLRGEWAVFYNYNQNDSTQAFVEFEQSVTGVRFGLTY